MTKFLNGTDVLQHSVDPSHNVDAVFNCLINAFGEKNLKLELLKELVIDEASVIADKHNGVAAKFKKLAACMTMTNITNIYYSIYIYIYMYKYIYIYIYHHLAFESDE